MSTPQTLITIVPANSAYDKVSRYTQGGLVDVYPSRLGWWARYAFPSAADDFTYTIPAQYNKRPDLVAYANYKQVGLMWLVLQYNTIVDIETEFVTGAVLTLPSQRRVLMNIITQQLGGNPVTSVP